jgi:hypothetical protein
MRALSGEDDRTGARNRRGLIGLAHRLGGATERGDAGGQGTLCGDVSCLTGEVARFRGIGFKIVKLLGEQRAVCLEAAPLDLAIFAAVVINVAERRKRKGRAEARPRWSDDWKTAQRSNVTVSMNRRGA